MATQTTTLPTTFCRVMSSRKRAADQPLSPNTQPKAAKRTYFLLARTSLDELLTSDPVSLSHIYKAQCLLAGYIPDLSVDRARPRTCPYMPSWDQSCSKAIPQGGRLRPRWLSHRVQFSRQVQRSITVLQVVAASRPEETERGTR